MSEEYFRLQATQLYNELMCAKQFFSKHALSYGMSGEEILRSFLQKMLPKTMSATQGFVIDDDVISKQCDIIIYNSHDYVPCYSCGSIEVVYAKSVMAVIEVKTTIDHDGFDRAIVAFELLSKMGVMNKYLFVFDKLSIKKLENFIFPRRNTNDDICISDTWGLDPYVIQHFPNALVSLHNGVYIEMSQIQDDQYDCVGYVEYCYKSGNDEISCLQLFVNDLWYRINHQTETYKQYKLDQLYVKNGIRLSPI